VIERCNQNTRRLFPVFSLAWRPESEVTDGNVCFEKQALGTEEVE
jgi:hypothetical protein